jgi:holo-[acyl-carrier protein] synthase
MIATTQRVRAAGGRGGATVVVDASGCDRVRELVAPSNVDAVFTQWERALVRRPYDIEHWAGRWAAKLAVAIALGEDDLLSFEVVERPVVACHDPKLCRQGHPPAVRSSARDKSGRPRWLDIDLSASHDGDRAICIARTSVRPADA